MKLSEAIVLGSTQINFDPFVFLFINENGFNREPAPCGCLLGMAMYADGERQDGAISFHYRWPWLFRQFPVPEIVGEIYHDRNMASAEAIISTMAFKVKAETITFEQALQWIRDNEPQEEVPVSITETEAVAV